MNYRLPVKREPVLPPAPLWQQAAPVVIRGAALVAAGVIGEWLLRSAAKKAISMPFSGKKTRAVARRRNRPKRRSWPYRDRGHPPDDHPQR